MAYDAITKPMAALADPSQVPDAFEAEVMISVLAGLVLQAGATGDDLASAFLDVVDELARSQLAHAYPALRAIAVAGPAEITEYATRAADRMAPAADRGGSPPWLGQLGQAIPGTCTMLEDPYRETLTLLCEFGYADGARSHGVLATLDATWHGSVIALAVPDPPDEARRQLARRARREGSAVREIPAGDAGVRLQAGIEALLQHGMPPGTDRKGQAYAGICTCLGIARHRAAVLAARASVADPPAVPADAATRWPEHARQHIAGEFLASRYGRDLRGPIARKLPFLMITTCVSQLGCDPLLVGPQLLERTLLQVFPPTLTAPDRYAAEIPLFMRAWAGWLAERQDMPPRRRRQLMLRLDFLLNRFAALWADGTANPLRRYVQDLPDDIAADGDAMFPVLERRTFAVPVPAERGDGIIQAQGSGKPSRRAGDLDAADEIDRQLITVLELSSRGLPRDRFASYTAVTEQIWAGSPPEVWDAVQRMRAAGRSRDAILDRLARTWDNAAAQDGYAAALARLAAPR